MERIAERRVYLLFSIPAVKAATVIFPIILLLLSTITVGNTTRVMILTEEVGSFDLRATSKEIIAISVYGGIYKLEFKRNDVVVDTVFGRLGDQKQYNIAPFLTATSKTEGLIVRYTSLLYGWGFG